MNVIYVDDERPALENFKLTAAQIKDISNLKLFSNGEEAVNWVTNKVVDIAFLDMEMPGLHGLDLARKLKQINKNIHIVFVTAFSQFAIDAFGVDVIGYVLKPYSASDIQKEINKAKMIRIEPCKKVVIETIPSFVIYVDGQIEHFGRTKAEELLALLVDRAGKGVTNGDAISCLWPDRPSDMNTQSLYRMTFMRMMDMLEKKGIGFIVESKRREKYICKEMVECDLYKILDGDLEGAKLYNGEYMREYSWAEERNAQLSNIIENLKKNSKN